MIHGTAPTDRRTLRYFTPAANAGRRVPPGAAREDGTTPITGRFMGGGMRGWPGALVTSRGEFGGLLPRQFELPDRVGFEDVGRHPAVERDPSGAGQGGDGEDEDAP